MPLLAGEASGKHAPHAFVHAQPWTKFRGKQVGRKEISLLTVHKPGHKANSSLEAPTASSAYGAFAANSAPRTEAVSRARRAFGSYGLPSEDAIGPVDIDAERTEKYKYQALRKSGKAEEPPADSLRWNPEGPTGGRGALAAAARRRAQEAQAEAEAAQVRAAPRPQPLRELPNETLTDAPGARVRTEKGLRYEEQRRVREKLEAERVATAAAAAEALRERNAGWVHNVLKDKERVSQLTDPRVQAELNKALNEPNRVAAEQFRARNTQRLSAERKY